MPLGSSPVSQPAQGINSSTQGNPDKVINNLLPETFQTRRGFNNIFKMPKCKLRQSRILHLVKHPFEMKKRHISRQTKLRNFIAITSALGKKMLMGMFKIKF